MKVILLILGLVLGSIAHLTAFMNIAHAHSHHEHHGQDHSQMHHLTFSKGRYHVHATWEKPPAVNIESVLRIEWKRGSDHAAIDAPGNFEVILWMDSMNHGSSPTQILNSLDANAQPLLGVYEITKMYFIMGGEWQVNIVLTLEDGTQETQTIDVKLPDAGSGHGGHGHHQHKH